jgi:hypothetical protein
MAKLMDSLPLKKGAVWVGRGVWLPGRRTADPG